MSSDLLINRTHLLTIYFYGTVCCEIFFACQRNREVNNKKTYGFIYSVIWALFYNFANKNWNGDIYTVTALVYFIISFEKKFLNAETFCLINLNSLWSSFHINFNICIKSLVTHDPWHQITISFYQNRRLIFAK